MNPTGRHIGRWLAAAAAGLGLVLAAGPAAPAGEGAIAGSPLEVRVLPRSEVFGETFTLGEIAELDGFDVKALKRLAGVEMGRSPLPGRSLRVSESLIRSRLRREMDTDRLALSVPKRARVERAARKVPAAEIERMVLERAARHVEGDPADLRQELRGTIPEAVLPKGELEWEVRPLGRSVGAGGPRTYRVIARVDGETAWRHTVRLDQKVYRDVVVAGGPIRRHQEITADDLEVVRRPVSGQRHGSYYADPGHVAGKKARRPIGANEAIQEEMLAIPFAVSEGGRVTVRYESPGLLLEVPGVAMVDGHQGDFIPVKNLQSGKVVYGIVAEGEIVRVN